MKIALFHNLPSGGAKRTVFEQTSRLARHHAIDLFSTTSADHQFADIHSFVQRMVILPFRAGRLFRQPWGRLNAAVRISDLMRLRSVMTALAKQINLGGYDVVLANACQFTFSPTLLRALRVPSLYFCQDVLRWIYDPPVPRPYLRDSPWRKRLDRVDPLRRGYFGLLEHANRTSMEAATLVVTNSHFVRESLYRLYGSAPDVCYHGVDAERFRPLGLPRENFVLAVGALSRYKGYDFMIESLSHIEASRRPLLMIVSNSRLDDEARYIQDLAETLGVQLALKSLVSDEELVSLYNRAALVLYTPVMESFGLVPLEAMACATPVIGVREGGVRETIVDGVTGILCDRNPCAFGQAMCALLDDKPRREQYGRQARLTVEAQWTWDKSVSNLEGHLSKAIANFRDARSV